MEELVSGRGRPDPDFWRDRRVLLTGHTGFKGSWAALWLDRLGARIHGLALSPDTQPNLWSELGDGLLEGESLVDLADFDAVQQAVRQASPQIVIHMAAQALVRRGYADPVGTVRTNLLGTAHLLEALRKVEGVEAVLIVTSDKVYANEGSGAALDETAPLGGEDPYSGSKAAVELLARSFARAFFDPLGVPVATARAGNVIGGGDWAADRLVPDVCRAAQACMPLRLRSPQATRPWQHVLEPLSGYLAYAQALLGNPRIDRSLNFGPPAGPSLRVSELAEAMGGMLGLDHAWQPDPVPGPAEAKQLTLDSGRARTAIGWQPRLNASEAVSWTARWYLDHSRGKPARALCLEQIGRYEQLE